MSVGGSERSSQILGPDDHLAIDEAGRGNDEDAYRADARKLIEASRREADPIRYIAEPLSPQGRVADIIHDWGGGYVGVVGGGAVGEVKTQTGSSTLFSETPLRGGLAGVTAGYNIQNGNMVYGVEANVSWAKVKGDKACEGFPAQNCYYELGWQGTARARVGVAMDRTLLYVTGGLAVALHHIKDTRRQSRLGRDVGQ